MVEMSSWYMDQGWDDHFGSQIDAMSMDLEGSIAVGRVSLESASLYRVLLKGGEVKARVSGRIRKSSVDRGEMPACSR